MNQFQTLQSGFKNLAKVVSTGNLRFGPPLASLRGIACSTLYSNRNVSASLTNALMMVGDNSPRAPRVKVLASTPNHGETVLEESVEESFSVQIEDFKDDPKRIEKMTVQELRTTLRDFGISTKGRKTELISSLKAFIDKKMNGQSSQVAGEQASSDAAKSLSDEIEGEILCDNQVDNADTALEINKLTRSKRRTTPSKKGNFSAEFCVKAASKKQKLSVKSVEDSGGKLSVMETAVSSETSVLEARNNVGISTLKAEPWEILAHKKPQKHWVPYNPRTMRPDRLSSDTKSLKIMSWNVNGLRALLKLEGFSALELAQREDFDVLCLQETKLQEKDVEKMARMIDGYHNNFWTSSVSKLGYSGTAIISRIKPLSVKYGIGISEHDSEGRLVTAEFDSFYLICGYVPNSGDGLKRLTYRTTEWDPSLSNYMKELEKSKPVILTGDLNCAHQEMDLYNPAGNKRTAGFTIEERQSFEKNFLSKGFVDTFRKQHPEAVGYTYWGYRHDGRKHNRGWRLDYFLTSESIADQVHDSYIVPDVYGSDHCPIGLVLKL